MTDRPKCAAEGCDREARARGFCDTDYRRMMRGSAVGAGREPRDEVVWKLRVRVAGHGSQPYYFSDRKVAQARAEKAAAEGTLLFFARYELEERIYP